MLTDFPEVCHGLREVERGFERLAQTIGDADLQVVFRGIVCIGNVIRIGDENAKNEFVKLGCVDLIQELMKKGTDENLKRSCRELLASLKE